MDFDGIEWVWFDLDDTLIDFATNSRLALERLYRNYDLGRRFATAESWTEIYERHNKALWEMYAVGAVTRAELRRERFMRPLTEGGVAADEAERMSALFDTVYLDYLAMEKNLVEGAVETLRHFRHRGFRIGVLSNGFAEVQHRKMATAGLTDLIDLTVLSDDCSATKPAREIYDYAMQRAGSPDPRRHLLVGDNPATDVAGAVAAGWRGVWLDRSGADNAAPEGAARITRLDQLIGCR